jgi:hypothetical protein
MLHDEMARDLVRADPHTGVGRKLPIFRSQIDENCE